MPFTLSHPLFAAPLKKVLPALSVTGLILGSMGPDIEYFVAMQPLRSIGHDTVGFFLLVLPVCIAIAFAFHYIIKPTLPALLPSIGGIDEFAAQHIQKWRLSTTVEWARFIVSLFIGFLSHLFMDNWTHSSGWFVKRLPFLQSTVFGDQVYHILQLSLSVLGIAIPALYVAVRWYNWRQSSEARSALMIPKQVEGVTQRSAFLFWSLLIIIAGILFIGKLTLTGNYLSISIWAVAPITSFLVGLYAACMLRAAYRSKQLISAVVYIMALFAAIMVYKLVQWKVEDWNTLWIVYNGVISIIVLSSAFQFRSNK